MIGVYTLLFKYVILFFLLFKLITLLKSYLSLFGLTLGCLDRVAMASDDISQLADALSKTHVEDGELSYKGLGLKLDNAESGQNVREGFY